MSRERGSSVVLVFEHEGTAHRAEAGETFERFVAQISPTNHQRSLDGICRFAEIAFDPASIVMSPASETGSSHDKASLTSIRRRPSRRRRHLRRRSVRRDRRRPGRPHRPFHRHRRRPVPRQAPAGTMDCRPSGTEKSSGRDIRVSSSTAYDTDTEIAPVSAPIHTRPDFGRYGAPGISSGAPP